jgi:hypothetical protein
MIEIIACNFVSKLNFRKPLIIKTIRLRLVAKMWIERVHTRMNDDEINEIKTLLDLGRCSFTLGKVYESLNIYAKAVKLASIESELDDASMSTGEVAVAGEILALGLAAKFPLTDSGKSSLARLMKANKSAYDPIKVPVVIVAGGSSFKVEARMQTYQKLMLACFRRFKGTIVSGGTTEGVSGLVGKVQQEYPNAIHAIGYIPRGKIGSVDKRYGEIRFTEGENFTAAEPLQYWTDIVLSGVDPRKVKLLGINGGRISAFEFRIALALVAQVGVIKGSGSEADKLLQDRDWNQSLTLFPLMNETSSVRSFVMQ